MGALSLVMKKKIKIFENVLKLLLRSPTCVGVFFFAMLVCTSSTLKCITICIKSRRRSAWWNIFCGKKIISKHHQQHCLLRQMVSEIKKTHFRVFLRFPFSLRFGIVLKLIARHERQANILELPNFQQNMQKSASRTIVSSCDVHDVIKSVHQTLLVSISGLCLFWQRFQPLSKKLISKFERVCFATCDCLY